MPRMGSFKRAFLGYRRADVDAALAARDARNWALERDAEEARQRYQLEDLWREAPRLDLPLSQDDVRGHLYGAAHG